MATGAGEPADDGIHSFGADRLEALVEVMFLAASADGEFSREERKHFLACVESLTDQLLTDEGLEALVGKLESLARDEGREARLAKVAERLEGKGPKRVARSLAVRLMAADGIVRTSERELIADMAEALGIGREAAADLVKEVTEGRS